MRSLLYVGAVLTSSGLVACTETVTASESAAESTSSTATAVVAVERTVGPGESTRTDSVIARFVRVSQGPVDEAALRIAGIADDVPTPGACAAPSDSAPVLQGRSVELLDVGPLALNVDSSAKATLLLARPMPDPAGVVYGVFYSTRSADVFSPGSRVSLRSLGGSDLSDGFSATVTAPREITDIHVGSTPSGVDVTWDPSDADPHDLFYVDVMAPAPRVVTRCTAVESGHVFVPQGAIPGIDDGQLAVHRLHRESFRAKGIEPGEVRFDVAKVVTFRRNASSY